MMEQVQALIAKKDGLEKEIKELTDVLKSVRTSYEVTALELGRLKTAEYRFYSTFDCCHLLSPTTVPEVVTTGDPTPYGRANAREAGSWLPKVAG